MDARARPQVTLPNNVDLIKTATFKELAPLDPDWYYIRAGPSLTLSQILGGLPLESQRDARQHLALQPHPRGGQRSCGFGTRAPAPTPAGGGRDDRPAASAR